MTSLRSRVWLGAALASVLILPQAAWAHFIGIKVEPAGKPGASKIRAFFNEDPEPHHGPQLKGTIWVPRVRIFSFLTAIDPQREPRA